VASSGKKVLDVSLKKAQTRARAVNRQKQGGVNHVSPSCIDGDIDLVDTVDHRVLSGSSVQMGHPVSQHLPRLHRHRRNHLPRLGLLAEAGTHPNRRGATSPSPGEAVMRAALTAVMILTSAPAMAQINPYQACAHPAVLDKAHKALRKYMRPQMMQKLFQHPQDAPNAIFGLFGAMMMLESPVQTKLPIMRAKMEGDTYVCGTEMMLTGAPEPLWVEYKVPGNLPAPWISAFQAIPVSQLRQQQGK
jgi:hypothetical protein